MRTKGEEQMLGRKLNLKMQEDLFEQKRRKGEEQMLERKQSLKSEWSLLKDFRVQIREEIMAGKNNLILDEEHQVKEFTQKFIKERETLKKDKKVLMKKQKEIQTHLENKEEEMVTRVTNILDMLEIKTGSLGQKSCTAETKENKKLDEKRNSI